MKRFSFVFFIIFAGILSAQEWDSIDFDIDSLFDEPLPDSIPSEEDKTAEVSVIELVRQRGFTFRASFDFAAGVAPGWSEAPWFMTDETVFSRSPVVRMTAAFDFDAQISSIFRVKSVIYFAIPGFGFSLGDFFFDYSLYDTVFIRAGKYNLSWGISPNYGFTNLLARVPDGGPSGDSFILKADIPLGVGGFQFLVLTRTNLMGGAEISLPDFGFGGKYNLALRQLDMNTGIFYQEDMALRGFVSFKTTIVNTELYNEWILAIDSVNHSDISFAANLGFARDFFGDKLSLNGELFYNAEYNSFLYSPETGILEAKVSPFIEGFNGALNLLYRFGGKGSPRVFVQAQYAPQQNSARLVPGFRLSPWSNVELYLAVPMALGNKDGYYYRLTDPRELGRPFSMVILLTLNGSVQFGHYY